MQTSNTETRKGEGRGLQRILDSSSGCGQTTYMLTKEDGVAVHDIYPLAGVNYHFYIYFMNIRNIWRTDGPSEGSTAVEKRVDGSSYRGI